MAWRPVLEVATLLPEGECGVEDEQDDSDEHRRRDHSHELKQPALVDGLLGLVAWRKSELERDHDSDHAEHRPRDEEAKSVCAGWSGHSATGRLEGRPCSQASA